MAVINEIADAASNIGTAYSFAPGDTFRGEIEFPGDRDWLRAELEAGLGYYWTQRGDVSVDRLSSGRLRLWDEAGAAELRDSGSRARDTVVIAIDPTSDRRVYVDATGLFDSSTYVGSYDLRFFSEISSNILTRERPEIDEIAVTSIDYYGDKDWFEFDIEAGYGYYFVQTGVTSADRLPGGRLIIRDEAGAVTLAETGSTGRETAIAAINPTEDRTVYVEAGGRNLNTSTNAVGDYEFVARREIAANILTREEPDIDEVISTSIDYFCDEDWFKFDVEAGYGYYFVQAAA